MRKPDPGWTFMVNWGPSGGWYYFKGSNSWAVCMGRLCVKILRCDIDPILLDWSERISRNIP